MLTYIWTNIVELCTTYPKTKIRVLYWDKKKTLIDSRLICFEH